MLKIIITIELIVLSITKEFQKLSNLPKISFIYLLYIFTILYLLIKKKKFKISLKYALKFFSNENTISQSFFRGKS